MRWIRQQGFVTVLRGGNRSRAVLGLTRTATRVLGNDSCVGFKTTIFFFSPAMLYKAVTVLTRRIHNICKKIAVCSILDELFNVC